MPRPVYEIEPGHSFMWNGDHYVVDAHEHDNTLVRRTMNSRFQFVDGATENFNPYAEVWTMKEAAGFEIVIRHASIAQ